MEGRESGTPMASGVEPARGIDWLTPPVGPELGQERVDRCRCLDNRPGTVMSCQPSVAPALQRNITRNSGPRLLYCKGARTWSCCYLRSGGSSCAGGIGIIGWHGERSTFLERRVRVFVQKGRFERGFERFQAGRKRYSSRRCGGKMAFSDRLPVAESSARAVAAASHYLLLNQSSSAHVLRQAPSPSPQPKPTAQKVKLPPPVLLANPALGHILVCCCVRIRRVPSSSV